METLLHMETVPSHNFRNLHEFVDKVESHVRGLCALDVPSSYSTVLHSVRTTLEPEKPIRVHTCYTDSRAVLHWITSSTKEWRQFIQNRVNQIRSLLPVEVWKHCHGAGNPADIPSIGVSFFQDC